MKKKKRQKKRAKNISYKTGKLFFIFEILDTHRIYFEFEVPLDKWCKKKRSFKTDFKELTEIEKKMLNIKCYYKELNTLIFRKVYWET